MGRDTVSLTTLLMRMVPPAVLLVPVFGIWTFDFCFGEDRCLAGTSAGIVLIYVAMNLPFVIWILQSFIQQVPIALEEAAKMDGANPFQIFFLVCSDHQAGARRAAIFTFRISWNEFLLANALADRSTRTVPVTIVNSLTEHDIDWGVIMATGMLLAVPPIIFTFVASRQIITGMTAGAVKGDPRLVPYTSGVALRDLPGACGERRPGRPAGSLARCRGAAVVADGSLVMEVVELLREPHSGAAAHRIPRGVGMARPAHGPRGRGAVSNRSHARQGLLFGSSPSIRAPEAHGSRNVHRSFT